MSDFFSMEVIISIVCFVVGLVVLSFCSSMDKSDAATRRDPKAKWEFIDGKRAGEEKQSAARSTIMTLIGAGFTLFGLAYFFINLKLK